MSSAKKSRRGGIVPFDIEIAIPLIREAVACVISTRTRDETVSTQRKHHGPLAAGYNSVKLEAARRHPQSERR